MLGGSLVTTAWRVFRLRMEETPSSYGGKLRMYWIYSRGQPSRGGPPAWGLSVGLTTPHRKKISLLRKRSQSLGPGYLGTTITNQNLIQEEIKRRLNSGNACYHSVRNLLSSRLVSENIKIRIYENYNFAIKTTTFTPPSVIKLYLLFV
jgi:hypothetical protein